MTMIEPDADWYGSYARRSAIADYLELLALQDRSFSTEELADRIRDNGWTDALGERIGEPRPPEDEAENIGEEIDRSLERAGDVLAVLAERSETAGDLYPFERLPSGRLAYSGEGPPNRERYVRLLALTVGHATATTFTPAAHQVFETVVEASFANAGFATTGIGARSRAGGSFHSVLTESCEAVGLVAYPDRAKARTFANDEGSDVISNVWTSDRRPGGLQLVGQVTCARSNDWDKKLCEPSDRQWRAWLGGFRSPVIYLAVPHHVEEVTRAWLMEKRDGDVVDRLRLVTLLPDGHVHGELAIVDHVLEQELL